MSDEPITVPQAEHQSAVDAVVDAIQANRGAPAAVTPAQPRPSFTYNSHTNEIAYHSDEDRRLAEQPVETPTMDDRNLDIEQENVVGLLRTEIEKLNEHTFTPQGKKVWTIPPGSLARIAQEKLVGRLMETAEYQKGRYEAAREARDTRDAANARQNDGAAIAVAWTGGSPDRQKILDKAVEEAEAKHVAEALIRARLGNLGS